MTNSHRTAAVICWTLFAFTAFSKTAAQIILPGPCSSSVTTEQNFNPTAYVGHWYENAKYPFIFEFGGICITADYGLLPNGNISVSNNEIIKGLGIPTSIKGTGRVVGPAQLLLSLDGVPVLAPYWILGTDYTGYTVVYSCVDILGLVHGEVVWILTREPLPPADVIAQANSVITSNGLSLAPLIKTDQKDCPPGY